MTNTASLTACFTWQALLDAVTQYFSAPSDPFVPDTLVVPSAGHGRYIAQHLARGSGICAGIQMVTPDQFASSLLEGRPDDPWRGASLVLAIADVLAADAEMVAATGTGTVFDAATRLAGVLDGYLRRCPSLLFNWEAGNDVGPTGEVLPQDKAWQPALWRGLITRLAPAPHPAQVSRDAAALVVNDPGRHGAVLVAPPDPIDYPIFDALAGAGAPIWTYRPVTAAKQTRYDPTWSAPVPQPPAPDDEPTTLLGQVQGALVRGSSDGGRVADGSIQIHASHGPNRQVEVLRDVLCATFDQVPGLEPRDVLVLTTDLKTYGPLIEAAFAPESGHPASGLRVHVAGQRDNALLAGLADCLRLAVSRATADDLVDWCRNPQVKRQFDLSDDERLSDLVEAAGITWGVDRAHRGRAGLDIATGTWLDGVQRLALALATVTPVGAAVPADGCQPQDAEIIGGLAELVSRLRRALFQAATPAPIAEWAARLTQTADELFAVGPDEAWMRENTNALLARWGRDESPALLTFADVAALLDHRRTGNRRPTYANGALQVLPLGELQGVRFRVVCVLGLDDATFPVPLMTRAEDLLFDRSAGPGIGEDARRRSRVAFRDALLAATDRFIVVTRGADERTGAQVPAPVAVLDLLADCAVPGRAGSWDGTKDGLVHRYPLQPYAWSNFAAAGRSLASYDRQSFRAARQLANGSGGATPPGWLSFIADGVQPVETDTVPALDDIESFLTNPARFLLRRACNLTLPEFSRAGDDSMPVELDSLADWSLGQSLLEDLIAGKPLSEARAQALARRECPPGRLGAAAVDQIVRKVGNLPRDVIGLGSPETLAVVPDERSGGVTGAVTTRGSSVIVLRYGRVKAAQVLACWVRLLALTAQGVEGLGGQVWGTQARLTLAPPDPDAARRILEELTKLTATAARQLVPLPADTGAALVGVAGLTHGPDPEGRADDAFAGKYGEGHNPAWRALIGDPSLAALRRVGAFDDLAKWLWQPISQAAVAGGGRHA
ncbi:MAG: exodeoxyribonuclease V subunit gamma [Propionibacteriaceae bacterium]|nr:exodeoxyribonuclease V subunit gamma [Propionibacteriaceae bacterium]